MGIMIAVGIIGCGKIADSHAHQVARVPGARIVGACDQEPLMAQQFCERFGVEHACTSLDEMVKRAKPTAVHITTPPQSHHPLAVQCLQLGCHVFVEKPFTLNTAEAEEVLAVARSKQLQVTVGHDGQFGPTAIEMRRLVREGYIGGTPVHMESTWCYDLGNATYAAAALGDRRHWARSLPGGLAHNLISHGVARIAEFLAPDSLDVRAVGFTSSFLRPVAPDVVDEIRVTVRDGAGTTAYFTFSTQMRPLLHQFRLHGKKNGLLVDEDLGVVIRLRGTRRKSYAEKFLTPIDQGLQYVGGALRSMYRFARADLHLDSGKHRLFEAFYNCIRGEQPPPIPYGEILATSRIMDQIFSQVSTRR